MLAVFYSLSLPPASTIHHVFGLSTTIRIQILVTFNWRPSPRSSTFVLTCTIKTSTLWNKPSIVFFYQLSTIFCSIRRVSILKDCIKTSFSEGTWRSKISHFIIGTSKIHFDTCRSRLSYLLLFYCNACLLLIGRHQNAMEMCTYEPIFISNVY